MRSRTSGWLLALAALCGCGAGSLPDPASPAEAVDAAASAPAPVATLGLVPGEAMTFDVSIAGMVIGEASLAVGQPGEVEGRTMVMVKSRVASTGAVALLKKVIDEATTTIDVVTGLPSAYASEVVMGDREFTATARFVGRLVTVGYQRKDEAPRHPVVVDFRNYPALEAHAAMAMTRQWRGQPGDTRTLWIIGGRRVWRTDLTMRGSETLGTSTGNRRTVRLDGSARRARNDLTIDDSKPPRTFKVWISDDADRVPLMVQAETDLGDVTMELTSYTPGTTI